METIANMQQVIKVYLRPKEDEDIFYYMHVHGGPESFRRAFETTGEIYLKVADEEIFGYATSWLYGAGEKTLECHDSKQKPMHDADDERCTNYLPCHAHNANDKCCLKWCKLYVTADTLAMPDLAQRALELCESCLDSKSLPSQERVNLILKNTTEDSPLRRQIFNIIVTKHFQLVSTGASEWFHVFPTEQPGPGFYRAVWKAVCEHGQLPPEKCSMSGCKAVQHRADIREIGGGRGEAATLELARFYAECGRTSGKSYDPRDWGLPDPTGSRTEASNI